MNHKRSHVPPAGSSQFPAWLVLGVLTLVFVIVLAGVRRGPVEVYSKGAQPRPIAARGQLMADEEVAIKAFNTVSSSVVFVTNKQVSRDLFHLHTADVEEDAGSGFVWDPNGYIVTNYHVVQNSDVCPGHPGGPVDLEGEARRHRPGQGHRRPEDRGTAESSAGDSHRHVQRPPGGAKGVRDRQSLRLRSDSDHRRDQRSGPRDHRRGQPPDQGRDSDRCPHESGQLRRSAARQCRPRDRHEHGDSQPDRGLCRHRICHSHRLHQLDRPGDHQRQGGGQAQPRHHHGAGPSGPSARSRRSADSDHLAQYDR